MAITKKTETKVRDLKPKMDTKAAMEVIERERQERAEKFKTAFEKLCQEYKCSVVAVGRFQGNQIETGLNIIAQ